MKVGVIADDLTGANGTGVMLVKQGLMAVTKFNTYQMDNMNDNTAICIDTDSRYIMSGEAKERIKETTLGLIKCNIDILCKRIDSTFRGNIGQEIDGILECKDNAISIVVPSYPALNRITVGGYLLINDIPLQETDVANDPIKPIKNSYLPDLLREQTINKIGLIELSTICQGSEKIMEEVYKRAGEGYKIIICDAVTEKHIQEIAKAMADSNKYYLLPADPGPLTSYYVGECIANVMGAVAPGPMSQDVHPDNDRSTNRGCSNKIMVSIGSVTSLTRRQLHYLSQKERVTPIHVNPEHLILTGEQRQQEISLVVSEALETLKIDSIIIVTTSDEDCPILNLMEISQKEGVTEDKIAVRISEGLAEISKHILNGSNNRIKGCIFSGGDVTASFCRVAEADGIHLVEEVMPLIAHGKLLGRYYNGLHIITKGGLVGDETALYNCAKFLKNID